MRDWQHNKHLNFFLLWKSRTNEDSMALGYLCWRFQISTGLVESYTPSLQQADWS